MKLILTSTVDKLGIAGDVVEVKDGYGRNFLMPRPCTLANGSMQPTTTRGTPLLMMRSAQGGVLPQCEHGSRLTYMVAWRNSFSSSGRTAAKALTSAWP